MTTADLSGIRSLLAGITPGPWDYEKFEVSFGVYSLEMRDNGDYPAVIGYPTEDEACTEADAAFIAAGPSTVERLLGIVERVEGVLDEWAAQVPFPDAEESQQWYSLGKRHAADRIRAALAGEGGE